ncbi:hypothetical protein NL676_038732 [Syzygium grande]|nr:hypothetical protein NL676_038732 [Syzygium grande]
MAIRDGDPKRSAPKVSRPNGDLACCLPVYGVSFAIEVMENSLWLRVFRYRTHRGGRFSLRPYLVVPVLVRPNFTWPDRVGVAWSPDKTSLASRNALLIFLQSRDSVYLYVHRGQNS